MAGIKQPKNKSHFILPDLGEGVHEAELIKWRVASGETVEEHQTLAEMETDKALVEVPSPWPGVVKDLGGHNEGDIVNVGDILVNYEIGSAGSDAPVSAKTAATAGAEREDAGTVVGKVDTTLTVPASFTRRGGEDNGAPLTSKALATPAVRRIARDAGIDINLVPGTGRGGRVTASDMQNFISTRSGMTTTPAPPVARPIPAPSASTPSPVTVSSDGTSEVIPFRGIRRKIAEALERSIRTAVHFTVFNDADVTALDRKRKEYSSVLGHKISFLPFIMTAICKGLRAHPSLNANVDDAKQEIHIKGVINLGIAVDTDHGLMVPVLPDADQLSLAQMGDGVIEVAESCRNRTIPRERLIGGTFTISNVGSYGGTYSTPIINYPEVAILGIGRAKERVLTKDGMFYAGLVLPLSLSCDHRVVDGAEGARFLNTVVSLLENPEELVQGI
ncbi:MAG: 2-oxo acid dehydrogenase subunit E2 [Planctomycetes bacterium]|nr:2-oxo acid dehydrogenase subunit E2 [Planctomycetota bacterium]